MKCSAELRGPLLILLPQGRLDAFGAKELDEDVQQRLTDDILCVAVDMTGVQYLSSAGLRTLMALSKKLTPRGGGITLANVQTYCRSVIDMAGCASPKSSAFPAETRWRGDPVAMRRRRRDGAGPAALRWAFRDGFSRSNSTLTPLRT